MNLIVTLEYRFDATMDGTVWTQTTFGYSFWKLYLEIFDSVRIVARLRTIQSVPADWRQASGRQVTFIGLPYYIGPWQYVLSAHKLYRTVREVVSLHDAVIMRVPSQVANPVASILQRDAHPYGVEVLGDPYDVFAPGAIKHPLRAFFRWWFTKRLRNLCVGASAAAYVTQRALQQRYPPNPTAFSVACSDVQLSDTAFVTVPRLIKQERRFVLIFVGTLAQLYKSPDILLDALAICIHRYHLNIELIIAGDGQFRLSLEHQAVKLDIAQRTHFLGQLPFGEAVRVQLDLADVFVLPSRQEGLPRAMIEAMARGLPCIGSTAGGIPELLPAEDLVPPGDAESLALKIREVVADQDRLQRMSTTNLEKAKQYHECELHQRRIAFFQAVRDRTLAWIDERQIR